MRPFGRMARLLRLEVGIVSISVQRELAHRTELLFQTLMTAAGIAGAVGALAVVYAHVEQLAGWRFGEAIVLLGVYQVLSGLLHAFVEPNLAWFAEDKVKGGHLDDVLLRPVPSIFAVSFGSCRPLALADALLGAGIVAGGVLALGADVTLAGALAAGLLVLVGAAVAWALRLLLACLAFWAPSLELSVLYFGVWQLGRYPVDVYAPWVRALLTYVVPVAFVSTFPARALTGGAEPTMLLGGLGAAAGSVTVVCLVWRAGLRRYTSATS